MAKKKDNDLETTPKSDASDAPTLKLVKDRAETIDSPEGCDGPPIPPDAVEESGDPPETTAPQPVLDTEARLKTVSAAYKNLQEEMTALQARADRQRLFQRDMMKGEVVRSLFEPLQNLRRSVNALDKAELESDLLSGLHMVVRDFQEAFAALGLQEVEAEGATFNPDFHQALSILPVTDPEQDGKVLEVFSAGYRIGASLLAPAQVIIGKYEEPVGDA
jgi:molecular chaperone GrpE